MCKDPGRFASVSIPVGSELLNKLAETCEWVSKDVSNFREAATEKMFADFNGATEANTSCINVYFLG